MLVDKTNKGSKYKPTSTGFTGYRARNMFYMTTLKGSAEHWIPNPDKNSGLQATIATMVNSARNTQAIVTAQKIGRDQVQFKLTWNFLSVDEWENILKFWDDYFFFIFYYYDPLRSKISGHKCYISDRTYSYENIKSNGEPTAYIDCSATITDTGV